MLKNKLLLFSAVMLGVCLVPAFGAENLSDVTFPKPPAYRVGISEIPERQYVQAIQEIPKPEKKYAQIDDTQDGGIADLTYADLSIKRLSKEVAQELEFEEQEMLSDLSLLWQGAAVQSDTINFTLYKLANPDADKPDEKSIKKVLSTIASMSTLVGASMGSPILAGSSLIGGNILGIMSQDTKALNYKYTRVNDADMIILIRKVEDLQQKAVNLYYDYMCAKKQLEMTTELVEDRQHKFELAQKNNAPRELVVITDAYYRTALDKQRSAKSDFFSKRAALEQFVGNETFVQFEAELLARENGETKKDDKSDVQVQEAVNTNSDNQNLEAAGVKDLDAENQSSSDSKTTLIQDNSENQVENNNLVNLNNLKPIDNEESEKEVMTGSSSSIENESNLKTAFLSKFKKDKDETVSEENKDIEKTKKEDKYSTKGLIFIHDNDRQKPLRWWESPKSNDNYDNDGMSVEEPSFVNNSPSSSYRRFKKTDQNEVNNSSSEKSQSSYKEVSKNKSGANNSSRRNEVGAEGYNFEPLEEIKAPELSPGGYSIHSPMYEGVNDNDGSIPSFQY